MQKCIWTCQIFFALLFFSIASIAAPLSKASCEANSTFNVGAGIYDITGPAAEQGMMGYGMIGQRTSGLYQRLWARAFVIESPCNHKRVVFVNTDLGMVFQGIKQEVVKKLKEKYGDRYDDSNVLLTATHTHSGPGGFSTYAFYNLTTLGFNRKNFDTIATGIVYAIDRAQHNMVPAQIKLTKGNLTGISFNRSPEAYLKNPQSERDRYPSNTDTQMTLIRFDALDGNRIGMINWFPLHGVSMNNKNHLINGDNKGYAEYLFEKDFHSDQGQHAFVAAFAQSNAGDVSPNPYGHEGGAESEGIKKVEQAGDAQYIKAKSLYANARDVLKGGIDYRHTYVKMDEVKVDPQYTDGKMQMTCPAAIGISMLAGTQDGEGIFEQGISCHSLSRTLPRFICEKTTTPCQGVKPIALQTGIKKPYPWTPNVLPLQVFKIGQLVIVAAPFELSTMTGRRLRETVAKQLNGLENKEVVLSPLANAYAGYVATNEEYQIQRYEGASTHFGPWTENALRQEFAKLAKALFAGEEVPKGPQPLDLSRSQINLQPGVVFDSPPLSKHFGDVYQDVKPTYKAGELVAVIFYGAHPKNHYRISDTFLKVEHVENGLWTTIRNDNDWDTEYHWKRSGAAASLVKIVWRIPKDAAKGKYRIVHYGDAKLAFSGKIVPYIGYSSPFTVD